MTLENHKESKKANILNAYNFSISIEEQLSMSLAASSAKSLAECKKNTNDVLMQKKNGETPIKILQVKVSVTSGNNRKYGKNISGAMKEANKIRRQPQATRTISHS